MFKYWAKKLISDPIFTPSQSFLLPLVGILFQINLSSQQDQCGDCVDFSIPYIYQLTNVTNGKFIYFPCGEVRRNL